MKYCTECGHKLEIRFLEDEGMIPYCPSCEDYRFPTFNVAVSVIILDTSRTKVLFINQERRPKNILVAGYVNQGEDVEDAVVRETMEEVGLEAIELKFNRSRYYERSNTLMVNFSCSVKDNNFTINPKEVLSATWCPLESSQETIAQNSMAKRFLDEFLESL